MIGRHQREENRRDLQAEFQRQPRQRPADQEDQCERRDHGDADHVADPELHRGVRKVSRRYETGDDEQRDVADRNQQRAGARHREQHDQVPYGRERRIEARLRPHQKRQPDRVAGPHNGDRGNLHGPRKRQMPDKEIGQKRCDE
jgi:hypothetical protein